MRKAHSAEKTSPQSRRLRSSPPESNKLKLRATRAPRDSERGACDKSSVEENTDFPDRAARNKWKAQGLTSNFYSRPGGARLIVNTLAAAYGAGAAIRNP